MREFNANDFASVFDLFVLKGFSDGPRTVPEIQGRIHGIERLMDIAATRTRTRESSFLPAVIKRLQREGLLKLDQSGAESVYSLTDSGAETIEHARARLSWIVSQFGEDGELDSSFRSFLNRQNLLGLN